MTVFQADTARMPAGVALPGTRTTTAADGGGPPYDSDIAPVAALLADRARAAMLMALLDGLPRAAGELSKLAGVTAATASTHLARLLDGGMLAVQQQGRHRYYRLASPEVATVIEVLAQVSPVRPARGLRQSREAAALAEARTCYDHLAGRAGVALLDALLETGTLTSQDPDGFGADEGAPGTGAACELTESGAGYAVTEAGAVTLASFGVDVAALLRSRRKFAGSCLDWTQRRPHLNGALGAAIMARLLQLGWIERGRSRRSVRVTPAGQDGLAWTFGWSAGD
jgi:DNA-binding transcriptional ArsR family regulator